MGYAASTEVSIYCNPDQNFVIHRAHHVWFDDYNYRLYIEENNTPGSLLIQKYPKSLIHH